MNRFYAFSDIPRMHAQTKRRTGWILAIAFIVALLMGPGPGMLLVNRPTAICGIPALYAWGLLWYAVEVVIVVLAYFLVWGDEGATHRNSPDNPR